jgi:hypothetical protein
MELYRVQRARRLIRFLGMRHPSNLDGDPPGTQEISRPAVRCAHVKATGDGSRQRLISPMSRCAAQFAA